MVKDKYTDSLNLVQLNAKENEFQLKIIFLLTVTLSLYLYCIILLGN